MLKEKFDQCGRNFSGVYTGGMSLLTKYFYKVPEEKRSSAAIAYLAALDHIKGVHPAIGDAIIHELKDQRAYLKLIASENYCSLAVQLAMGNLLTDKYSEGHPFHRFYAGCDNVDFIEHAAVQELKNIFNCEHAYVQPHSGADANMVAFWSILVHRVQNKEVERLGKKNIDEMTPAEYEQMRQLLVSQKVMGLSLSSGGHLTHGYRHNMSAKMMESCSYDVDPGTGLINYEKLAEDVKREKPAILIGGYSSYPRLIDFAKMREIADSVGATLLVDMAHFSGLVAGKVLKGNFDPIPFAHVVTSTTHKTLRGPRGGFILCKDEYKAVIDKGCPLVLGGPLPHVMAAKAIAFKESNTSSFQKYAHQIVANAKTLAETFLSQGVSVTTNGTDNHLLVINVATSFGLNGRQAETALREAFFTVNRNAIPFDENGPWYTSGVRIGPAALTTLGMKEDEMRQIAMMITELLKNTKSEEGKKAQPLIDQKILKKVQTEVKELLGHFPLYPEIIID